MGLQYLNNYYVYFPNVIKFSYIVCVMNFIVHAENKCSSFVKTIEKRFF